MSPIPWGPWRMDTDSPTEPAAWPEYVGPSPATAAFGGLRRDVCAPRRDARGRVLAEPLAAGYQLADARTDVERIRASGASLVFHNVNSAPIGGLVTSTDQGNVIRARLFAQACAEAQLPTVLAPDVGTGGHEMQSTEEFAAWMSELACAPYAVSSGRVLFTPYLGEYEPTRRWWSAGFWRGVLDDMRSYGLDVALVPMPNALPNEAMDALAGVVAGWSIWGGRSTGANDWVTDACNRMRARPGGQDLIWITPISAGQAVPHAGRFDEGAGFDQVLATSRQAVDLCTGPDDLGCALTWNDFTEGTALGPSLRSEGSTAWTDVISHALGTKPLTDWVGLAYRGQLVAATEVTIAHDDDPTSRMTMVTWTATCVTRQMKNARVLPYGPPTGTPTVDVVSVVTVLAEPATAYVTVGSHRVGIPLDGGFTQIAVPNEVGPAPKVELWRYGKRIVHLTGPEPVHARPRLQDLTYLTATASAR